MAGMSLSDFLLAELRRLAERPTIAELRERLRRRSRVAAGVSAADAVRRDRDYTVILLGCDRSPNPIKLEQSTQNAPVVIPTLRVRSSAA